MKLLKNITRLMIAASSVGGFVGGWALLAHAPKPVAASSQPPALEAPASTPLPTLEPIPSLGQSSSSLQPLPSLPQSFVTGQPRLRTRGS